MTVVTLINEVSYAITSAFESGGSGLSWILATGFWDDNNIWLDEQTWNDGV